MTKVFISYKRADASRVKVVREKLAELLIPIFSDVDIRAGAGYVRIINEHLSNAAAVFVLWTNTSIVLPKEGEPNFFFSEVDRGYNRQILVAATLDKIDQYRLPVPYNGVQAPDLSDWLANPSAKNEQWRSVLAALSDLLTRPGLVALADTLEDGSEAAKLAFLCKFPNDPAAAGFADQIALVWRKEFEERQVEAQRRIERRKSESEQQLRKCRDAFEQSLGALRRGESTMPPDPINVLEDNVKVLQEDNAFLRDALKQQYDRADRAESTVAQGERTLADQKRQYDSLALQFAEREAAEKEASSLATHLSAKEQEVAAKNAEIARLRESVSEANRLLTGRDREIEKLGQDNAALKQGRPGSDSRASHRTAILAAMALLLVGSVVGATGHWLTSPNESPAQASAAVIEAATSQTDENRRKAAALDKREQALAIERYKIDAERDALKRSKDDFATLRKQLEAQKNAPPAQPATAANPEITASIGDVATNCDKLTAFHYDPDRPLKGKNWVEGYDEIAPEIAIPICQNALNSATDKQTIRRLTVNIGRAYAAQGRAQASNGDKEAAKHSFDVALKLWQSAAREGSGQAVNLLGVYNQGSFEIPTKTGKFNPIDKADLHAAFDYYQRAAKMKNPAGLSNAAAILLKFDKRFDFVDYDEAPGREYLEDAVQLGYPSAVYNKGLALLNGLAGYPVDKPGGIRLVEQAFCQGYGVAANFFAQSRTYKAPACPQDVTAAHGGE